MTLGLAFLPFFRLLSLIAIPTLCSNTGRAIIFVYILVLVSRGPASNIGSNVVELSRAISCSGDAGRVAFNDVVDKYNKTRDDITQPFVQVKDSLKKMAKSLADKARKVRSATRTVYQTVKNITKNMPNCSRIPYILPSNPYDLLNPPLAYYNFVKNVASLHALRGVCILASKAGKIIKKTVQERVDEMKTEMKEELYVDIDFDQNFSHTVSYMQMNNSITYAAVFSLVKQDLSRRLSWIDSLITFLGYLNPLLSLVILFRSWLYIKKYKKKLHFDNKYLDDKISQLDLTRAKQGLETILPLDLNQRKHYIVSSSLRMTESEVGKLVRGVVLFAGSTSVIFYYMTIDYGLFSVVDALTQVKNNVSVTVKPPVFEFKNVSNDGSAINAFYGDVAHVARNSTKVNETSTVDQIKKCWPTPSEPDQEVKRRIIILLIYCFVTVVIEAYTLRIRHVVCDFFYPDISDKRTRFLYNELLQSRGSFASFFLKQFKARVGSMSGIEKVSLIDRLTSMFPLIRVIRGLSGHKFVYCSNCGKQKADHEDYSSCESTINCSGIYCSRCLLVLSNTCLICSQEIKLIDESDDVSQERDSSDEDSDYYDPDFEVNDDDDFFFAHLSPIRKNITRIARDFSRDDRDHDIDRLDDHHVVRDQDREEAKEDVDAETILKILSQETRIDYDDWKRMIDRTTHQFK